MRDVSVGLPPRFRQPPQRKPGSAAGGRSTLAPLARQASGGEAKLGAPSAHHPSGSAPEGKFLLGEQALGVPAIGFPTRAAGRRAAVNAAATVGHGGGLAGGAPPGLCSAPGGRVQGGDVALIAESRLRRDERDHRALHRVDSRCCMGVRGGGVFGSPPIATCPAPALPRQSRPRGRWSAKRRSVRRPRRWAGR